MFFTFVSSAIVACLKFLFLLVDFFVKIWLLYAFILFNSPVPVFLKRFAAALLVFTFGIIISSCQSLDIFCQYQTHALTL